ncbi:MAG: hypothetical protein D6741_12325 [Planctomycetota bacterium]|nr:MAG: hypothetical protein D6741_12325 [Planctomycetota bacterium]
MRGDPLPKLRTKPNQKRLRFDGKEPAIVVAFFLFLAIRPVVSLPAAGAASNRRSFSRWPTKVRRDASPVRGKIARTSASCRPFS